MRETLGVFQENATWVAGDGPSEAEKEEQRQVREQVLDVLSLPGYSILHRLMVDKVEEATRRLTSGKTLDIDSLRYEQGIIEGIRSVQSRFIQLSKSGEED